MVIDRNIFMLVALLGLVITSYAKADDRYINNGDGTVVDNFSGLVWTRCVFGKEYRNNSCQGDVYAPDYFGALTAIKKANRDNYKNSSGWRLPTILEIISIVYCPNGRNEIKLEEQAEICVKDNRAFKLNEKIFPDTNLTYSLWTSSVVKDKDMQWTIYAPTGNLNDYHIKNHTGFFMVRGLHDNEEPIDKFHFGMKVVRTEQSGSTTNYYIQCGNGKEVVVGKQDLNGSNVYNNGFGFSSTSLDEAARDACSKV